ncbi:hypothetical protein QBC45DRAFT_60114 [Copromyces sp. CBS 386.78]|nr:hypothetical protein QBC45DRAFT_60114 [Copromyces sp. CBS 386.78]
MNPLSPPGAMAPHGTGGVLGNDRKRTHREFEAGGPYQSKVQQSHRPLGHRPQSRGHFTRVVSQDDTLSPPALAQRQPQPSVGYAFRQYYNGSNSTLNALQSAHKPPQPWGHSMVQQHLNDIYPFGSSDQFTLPSIRAQSPKHEGQQLELRTPPLNELLVEPVAAVPDHQPHVQDYHPWALDNGRNVDWDIWGFEHLPASQDQIHDPNLNLIFQDWEIPVLPDG